MAEQEHDGLSDQCDVGVGRVERRHFDDGWRLERSDGSLGLVHLRLGSCEIVLDLRLHSLGLSVLLGDNLLFFLDLSLDHVGFLGLAVDNRHRLGQIDIFLSEDGRRFGKGDLELSNLLVGLLELLQTLREAVLVRRLLLALAVESVDVQTDQVKVRLGRGVDLTSELVVELIGSLFDTRVDDGAHLGELFADVLIGQLHLDQLLLRHIEKRLSGPLTEPVERTAVDQRRELTAADSESVADWRHAQANVELLAHSLDEGLLDEVIATLDLDLVGQLLIDVIFVLSDHQVGHFTSV
mmetsp:Transcript_6479/g.8711  ORF Transcript_6479/g.8711 Transcript_6479/m.8711 type:complete len:296 (+) Transcript_6479:4233-5120(+)